MGRKLRAFSRYRPRVLTLVVFCIVAATLVLANLSCELVRAGTGITLPIRGIYGWPLCWHWHNLALGTGMTGGRHTQLGL